MKEAVGEALSLKEAFTAKGKMSANKFLWETVSLAIIRNISHCGEIMLTPLAYQ